MGAWYGPIGLSQPVVPSITPGQGAPVSQASSSGPSGAPQSGDVSDVWNASLAKAQGQQAAVYNSDYSKELRFVVALGLLAWGISKRNVYLTITGAGIFAYQFLKGDF